MDVRLRCQLDCGGVFGVCWTSNGKGYSDNTEDYSYCEELYPRDFLSTESRPLVHHCSGLGRTVSHFSSMTGSEMDRRDLCPYEGLLGTKTLSVNLLCTIFRRSNLSPGRSRFLPSLHLMTPRMVRRRVKTVDLVEGGTGGVQG